MFCTKFHPSQLASGPCPFIELDVAEEKIGNIPFKPLIYLISSTDPGVVQVLTAQEFDLKIAF